MEEILDVRVPEDQSKLTPSESRYQAVKDLAPMVKEWYETDGELGPFFMVKTETGDNILIATMWGDEDEKVMMIDGIRKLMIAKKAVSYVQVSEVWIKGFKGGKDDPEYDPNRAPSEYPDREEAVMLSAVDYSGVTVVHMPIIRTNDGPPRLGEMTKPMDAAGGRMTELLPPRQTGPLH